MKGTLLTLAALASSVAVFSPAPAQAQRVSIGIGINIGGPPIRYYAAPPPAPYVRYRPARPGRAYVWVPGYYVPAGRAWRYQDGYWAQPPRGKKRWVQPRYRDDYFYSGYWR